MSKDFKVGCSPMTSVLYAGKVLKDGNWAEGIHDVTDSAVGAVAQHLLQLNQILIFTYKGDQYELKVQKITKKTEP